MTEEREHTLLVKNSLQQNHGSSFFFSHCDLLVSSCNFSLNHQTLTPRETCYTADRTSAPTLRPQLWEPWSASHTPCASGGSPWRSPAPPGTLPPDTEAPSP
ncbi:hypothetical protein V8G54_021895 [Vigna mungo]|uniref:Uncharacterized protein n=1 Tax=Vigna mungo TaxID=3915 RepID=A0AAQ3NE81_VIGMU